MLKNTSKKLEATGLLNRNTQRREHGTVRWQHISQILVTLGDHLSLDDVVQTFVRALETFLYSVCLEGHSYQEWLEVLSSEPSDKPGGNLSLLRHVGN